MKHIRAEQLPDYWKGAVAVFTIEVDGDHAIILEYDSRTKAWSGHHLDFVGATAQWRDGEHLTPRPH